MTPVLDQLVVDFENQQSLDQALEEISSLKIKDEDFSWYKEDLRTCQRVLILRDELINATPHKHKYREKPSLSEKRKTYLKPFKVETVKHFLHLSGLLLTKGQPTATPAIKIIFNLHLSPELSTKITEVLADQRVDELTFFEVKKIRILKEGHSHPPRHCLKISACYQDGNIVEVCTLSTP